MDRRELLQLGAATVAASSLAKSAFAQGAPAAAAPVFKKLKIDAYSRHLLWLDTAEDVADAVIEMGYDGLDITVRPPTAQGAKMGHVLPENVARDLPLFVGKIRAAGLIVDTITCPITDADSMYAESILDTASKLGISHYWWGTFRYDQTLPQQAQLDALKPRVAKLAKLNQKYGMKAMYHNYSGPGTVGDAIYDLLEILRENDPRWVSFHYDTGHGVESFGFNTWVIPMRAAGPYIGGLSVKDSRIELNLDVPEGGPFTGTPAQLNAGGRGGGAGGPPGAPGAAPGVPGAAGAAPAAGGGGRGGRGGAGAAAAAPAAGGVAPPPAAGGRGAAGAAGGAAGGGGRGGAGGGAPAAPDPRGGGGQTNPWRNVAVPLGTGLLDLPLLATTLKEINFNGPVEIQSEYPNGGANNAGTKLTWPRALVLGNMKRDLLTLKAAFGPAGLI